MWLIRTHFRTHLNFAREGKRYNFSPRRWRCRGWYHIYRTNIDEKMRKRRGAREMVVHSQYLLVFRQWVFLHIIASTSACPTRKRIFSYFLIPETYVILMTNIIYKILLIYGKGSTGNFDLNFKLSREI